MTCNFDCFHCRFSDCICDFEPTATEMLLSDKIDHEIDFEQREENARLNGTINFFRYNHSEKGLERLDRYNRTDKGISRNDRYNKSDKGKARVEKYNSSEKGKARQKKYYQSEKGRENERRKAERKRLKRLQQKGVIQHDGMPKLWQPEVQCD